jgi:hypothetical protein
MKNIFDLKTLLIICLVFVIFLMRMCGGESPEVDPKIIKIDGKKYEVVKHKVDTIIVPVKQTEYRDGKTIYKDTIIYVQIPMKIDTNIILKDYFSKVVYVDTLKLKDSLGYVSLKDTITKNSILNRVFDAKINKTTIRETLVVKEPPVNEFYLGGVAGFDKTNIVNFLGPNLTIKTKKEKMFTFGVGYGLNRNITIQAGMLWKIKFKK